ncbi:hypothetical protein [Salinicola aestuarinus]|uniref:hypothetical protein n=1 Tax=Salinicola aestuarinus TaxID=1949082 RepID=UPI000DA159C5|nr:hypothetical protein [Salinicola aestuarinus]
MTDIDKLVAALDRQTAAMQELTASNREMVESNNAVVDMLLAEAEEEGRIEEPPRELDGTPIR